MATSKAEQNKEQSHFLRGTIQETLRSDASHFGEEDIPLLKFHGTYQQDDRDARGELRKAGLDKAWSFMVRTKIPGGHLAADEYLKLDIGPQFRTCSAGTSRGTADFSAASLCRKGASRIPGMSVIVARFGKPRANWDCQSVSHLIVTSFFSTSGPTSGPRWSNFSTIMACRATKA